MSHIVTVHVNMWYEISTLWRICISVCISHQQQAKGAWMVAAIINLWSPWQTRAPFIYVYIWTHIYIHSMYPFPYSLWFLFLQHSTTCFCCEKTSQTFPSCIRWILRVKNPPLDPPSQPKSQLCSWKQVWARREQPWMLGETTRLEMVSRQEMDMYLPHGLK